MHLTKLKADFGTKSANYLKSVRTTTVTTNPLQVTLRSQLSGANSGRNVGGEVRYAPQDTVAGANEISNTRSIRHGLPSFIMQQVGKGKDQK